MLSDSAGGIFLRLGVGQIPRRLKTCQCRYCTIPLVTDTWSLDGGRVFVLHPSEVMSSASPTQRLFTPAAYDLGSNDKGEKEM